METANNIMRILKCLLLKDPCAWLLYSQSYTVWQVKLSLHCNATWKKGPNATLTIGPRSDFFGPVLTNWILFFQVRFVPLAHVVLDLIHIWSLVMWPLWEHSDRNLCVLLTSHISARELASPSSFFRFCTLYPGKNKYGWQLQQWRGGQWRNEEIKNLLHIDGQASCPKNDIYVVECIWIKFVLLNVHMCSLLVQHCVHIGVIQAWNVNIA